MRFSEAWLREFVDPPLTTAELVAQLTMAGLEVDAVEPVAGAFERVVVGEILAVAPHPDADKLKICQVAVGAAQPLTIVCGAANARVGLRAPVALVGAVLPNGLRIAATTIRGQDSFGMMCSEQELGLAESAQGLWELPDDLPVGSDLREVLRLNDQAITVDLTPNRADCLSVFGMAREVAALNALPLSPITPPATPITSDAVLPLQLHAPSACPRYLGRLITGVNGRAASPMWLRERLRRSGLRSLGAIVDVTNYVLLELGQPLHAFDAAKLHGGLHIRHAQAGETLSLLNGQTITLDAQSLVIADDRAPLALAGVMGGQDSAVSETTQSIFLECAFFAPLALRGTARRYGLHTDSSHRFERGVDPELTRHALERATQLILELAGGQAGPVITAEAPHALPTRLPIPLRRARVAQLLGVALPDDTIENLLQRLSMTVDADPHGWHVTPPSFRFDLAIEADLIEELARVYGYNTLPQHAFLSRARLAQAPEGQLALDRVKDLLVARDYQEVITYSFVDPAYPEMLTPALRAVRLQNPISSEMAVMRTTLWSGLLSSALWNVNRQRERVRLFETGLCFDEDDNGQYRQIAKLAGLALGHADPEQWGCAKRAVDFFDVKADVEALLALGAQQVRFEAAPHDALHPGQSARILDRSGATLGWLGRLHPNWQKRLGFDQAVFLFELEQAPLLQRPIPRFQALSKYPSVRRDLALVLDETISCMQLLDAIRACQISTLQDSVIFDVYRGPGIAEGQKSVAVGLIFQDFTQTLTDHEIDAIVTALVKHLSNQLRAKLRD